MSRYPAAAMAPIQAEYLTDDEKIALALIRFSGEKGINAVEIAAQTLTAPSGKEYHKWDDQTQGRLGAAIASLKRFGFIDERYDRPDYSKRPGQTGYGKGRGWLYYLNPEGEVAMSRIRAYSYRCCDNCVSLFCVCAERTFCPEHGGGCHGTHD